MTDTELLFIVLALVYGWECACWVRRGSVLFVIWFGARWRIRHPGTLLGNQQGGFVFAPPLPPLGTIFLGHQFPLSLSPDAALAYVASTLNPGWRPVQSGNIARFDEMRVLIAAGDGFDVHFVAADFLGQGGEVRSGGHDLQFVLSATRRRNAKS